MTYSLDLQQKVLQYIDKTGNISKASNVAQMSRNTIYQWLKLQKKTGSLNHQARGTQLRKVDANCQVKCNKNTAKQEFDSLNSLGYPKQKSCRFIIEKSSRSFINSGDILRKLVIR